MSKPFTVLEESLLRALEDIAAKAADNADYCSDKGPNLAMRLQLMAEDAMRRAGYQYE